MINRSILLFVALGGVSISFIGCGGGGSPTNAAPTPTQATPLPATALRIRWEVRTTCGGTHNGVPVPSDVYPPPYDFKFGVTGCYRIMASGLPAEGCSADGQVVSDKPAFNDSNTWGPIGPATISYIHVPGELQHADDEQDLNSVTWDLNPGTYNWTATIGWRCNRSGVFSTGSTASSIQIVAEGP
jgi:hypothetical protein